MDRLNIPAQRRPQAPRGHVPPEERRPWVAGPLLDRVRLQQHQVVEHEQQLHELVIQARHNGASWQQIADALGITVKAAWKRYVPA